MIKKSDPSCLKYWDVNNLYRWVMPAKLTVNNNFEWIEDTYQFIE